MRKAILGALLVSATASAGCIYATVVPSTAGKAWVVKATPFGGSYWNCDATKGEPTCYQVIDAPATGGAK